MAEFGLPEMADQQAQDLLARAPDDAVAWAVTGYVAAKRNQMDAAATNLVSAAQLAPDDVFVQRTGAQIVAWADSRKDKTEVTPQTLVAIGTIRNKLSGKPEFAQAYQEALDAYQRLASTAATQPATPAPAAVAPGYDSMLEPNYNPDVLSGGSWIYASVCDAVLLPRILIHVIHAAVLVSHQHLRQLLVVADCKQFHHR